MGICTRTVKSTLSKKIQRFQNTMYGVYQQIAKDTVMFGVNITLHCGVEVVDKHMSIRAPESKNQFFDFQKILRRATQDYGY